MASAQAHGLALVHGGVQLITVIAEVSEGLPEITFVGLSANTTREARDRIRAAIVNSGEDWPSSKLAVRLSPVSFLAQPSYLDLAIAVAILGVSAGGRIARRLSSTVFVGELGLDGCLRSAPGVSGLVTAVREIEWPTGHDDPGVVVVTPVDALSAEELAALRSDRATTLLAVQSLADVVAWLRGRV
jgi:magnesium chelatase family protein